MPMTELKQPEYNGSTSRRPAVFSGVFLGVLLLIFLTAFGYAGFLFFQTARNIVLNAPQLRDNAVVDSDDLTVTGLGMDEQSASQEQAQTTDPQSSIAALLAPIWNEQEPINILLLGIDQRPGEKGSYRTDTMILVNIDPRTGSIGMMSMPRDLWVTVPTAIPRETRINSAHFIGDSDKNYPGDGPTLAKETVSLFLGQPVHYYVRINFEGFRALLDEIGCLDIEVPYTINDPEFPDDNYGYDPFYIEAGQYCMDADTVLKYARTRHQDTDFGRMRRQQQVLVAAKNKVLSVNELPRLLSRLPALLDALSESLQTDMPMSQQITLANMARRLNTDNIRQMLIDGSMVEATILPSGAYVLMPKLDLIQPAVESFFNPEVVPTPNPTDDLYAQLERENVRIAVLNGTSTPDLSLQVGEWLAAQGFIVVGYGEADRTDYTQTQLIDYGGAPFTTQHLIELFAIVDENIRPGADSNDQADIQLIIGADFKLPSP
jgi:LCP family protein required for cell wall assembly